MEKQITSYSGMSHCSLDSDGPFSQLIVFSILMFVQHVVGNVDTFLPLSQSFHHRC